MYKLMAAPLGRFSVQRDNLAGAQVRLDCISRFISGAYSGLGVLKVSLLSSSMNDNYSLETAQGKFVLRITRPDKDMAYKTLFRDRPGLPHEIEHGILNYLHENKVECPAPLRREDGAFFGRIELETGEERTLVIQKFIVGVEKGGPGNFEPFRLKDGKSLGNALAQWHLAGHGFKMDGMDRWHFGVQCSVGDSLAWIQTQGGFSDENLKLINTVGRDLLLRLQTYEASIQGKKGLYSTLHGDMNGTNQKFKDDGSAVLFDTDMGKTGPVVFDLAQFMGFCSKVGDQKHPLWQAFLDGYRSVNTDFRYEDLDRVRDYMMVYAFQRTGMRIVYTQNGGPEKMMQTRREQFSKELILMVSTGF